MTSNNDDLFKQIKDILSDAQWQILMDAKRDAPDGKVVLDMQSEHGKVLQSFLRTVTGHHQTYISPQAKRGGVSTGVLLLTKDGKFVLCDTPQPEINPGSRAIRKPGGFIHMDKFLPFPSETLKRCADKLGGWMPDPSKIDPEFWARPYCIRKDPYDMKYEKNCWGMIQFVPYWVTAAELEDIQAICKKLKNPIGVDTYSIDELNDLHKRDVENSDQPKNLSLDGELPLFNTIIENGWNLPPKKIDALGYKHNK